MTSADPSRRISDSKILLAELRQRLGDPDLKVVDVRALPAYNGWRSPGAAPGGPISPAGALPRPRLGGCSSARGAPAPPPQAPPALPRGGLLRPLPAGHRTCP